MRRGNWMTLGLWAVALAAACANDDAGGSGDENPTSSIGDGDGDGDGDEVGDGDGDGDGDEVGDGDGDGDGDETPKFDVGGDGDGDGDGDPPDVCKVNEEGDGTVPCEQEAPPDSFEPEEQWQWDGDGALRHSIVTPLVANLTDDNNDGEIDLCDVPDVVVVVNEGTCQSANIYVLDGATGSLHFEIPGPFARASTPALGDVDNDGVPEIVVQSGSGSCAGDGVSVFENDGTLKWANSYPGLGGEHAVALGDLDTDGDVEIMINNRLIDHEGNLLQTFPDTGGDIFRWTTTAAADIDDDGELEVVLGRSAWNHDGTQVYWDQNINPGQPAIGDLDEDGEPEIIVVHQNGFSMLEHNGSPKFLNQNPTGDNDYRRPATIHDLDGDDLSEFALSSSNHYTAYEWTGNLDQLWSGDVADLSGLASGTAFDFLGDGVAEAIYGDEHNLWVYDGQSGDVVLSDSRRSITIVEYPVVSDIDNDGFAEIVVVSNNGNDPTVRAIRDAEDRWIQARRIWNQHTYHVTNVREDGTIPENEAQHWELLNTFRTNAQIEGGAVCDPEG